MMMNGSRGINTPITPRDLIDLACFYSMTYKPAAVIFALRALTEFRDSIDDPVIVTAARSLIRVLDPSASI